MADNYRRHFLGKALYREQTYNTDKRGKQNKDTKLKTIFTELDLRTDSFVTEDSNVII